jgi:Tol biopolymer transport system component
VYAVEVGPTSSTPGKPVRVTTGMGAHSVDLSADGERLVYAAYASSANVWAMPIPTDTASSPATAVPLTFGNQTVEGVRVSHDGKWLLYDSNLSGNSDVYRLPIAGGEAEQLTSDSLDEFRGVLSPNGEELVYHSFRTGARNLFLKRLADGEVQQLTASSGHRSMANWSPDGTALVLFDISSTELFVMRRDGRGQWSRPRPTGGVGLRPEWSPDGRTIVSVSASDGRIRATPADSGMQRDLYVPREGEPLAELAIFSADGRALYFKSHDARGRASFWSVPVSGGRPRLLARFDDPEHASNRFDFASDGKRLYFTVEDRQSDIWIAECAAH